MTPTLVSVEVLLVVSGALRPTHAVVIFVVIESAIAMFAVGAVIAAGRVYRRSARTGTRLGAAEKALESVLPRRVAKLVVIESRAWLAFARWLRRRRLTDGEFSYGAGLRALLLMVIGLLVIEGVVVELIVAMVFGHGWWLWVLTGLHLYALCWISGIAASLRTMPHHIGSSFITLRDSIFGEFQLSVERVTDVRLGVTANTGRSGLLINSANGAGRLCHGDGTVSLTFRDNTTIRGKRVQHLAISVDRPAEFVTACAAVMPARMRSNGQHGRRADV